MAGIEEQAKVKDSKVAVPPISTKNTDVKKEKKPKGKMIFIIIAILIIAFAGVSYYFNLFGVKDQVVYFFITQDTQYQKAVEEQNTQKSLYEKKQQELDAQLAQIDKKKTELDTREQKIVGEEKIAAATTGGNENQTANLEKLTEMYNAMAPESAATILNQITNNDWVATILSNMEPKKASKVLEKMEPVKAADITRIMVPQ